MDLIAATIITRVVIFVVAVRVDGVSFIDICPVLFFSHASIELVLEAVVRWLLAEDQRFANVVMTTDFQIADVELGDRIVMAQNDKLLNQFKGIATFY